MGKYRGNSIKLVKVQHPILNKPMFVPSDYEFYSTGAEKEKWLKLLRWIPIVGGERGNIIIDAFAGIGIHSMIYVNWRYEVWAIEKNPILFKPLDINVSNFTDIASVCVNTDNMDVLTEFQTNDGRVKIIDLDPYGHCVPQIKEAARILREGLLFITAGDIYAGVRFKNWGFAKGRYGIDFRGPKEDYSREVVYEFAKKEFRKQGKSVKLIDYFTFPTICRLCIKVN